MSKYIKATPEIEEKIREEFEKAVKGIKMAEGKFSFSVTFMNEKKSAVIYYSPLAWEKQNAILREFGKEVAWHGVARRGDDLEKDEYYVDDIMVYPQSVTAASVEMDTEEYATWLMENAEDERFDNIRMQAHSHVNMGVTPSGVDLNHQEEILAMLGDDDFYIFMIWNKSLDVNTKIYDMKKNILFETGDVMVKVEGLDYLEEFIDEAKDMVKNRVYSYNKSYGFQNPRPVVDPKPFNPVAKKNIAKSKGSGKKGRTNHSFDFDDDYAAYAADDYDYLKTLYGDEVAAAMCDPFYYRD